MPDLQWLFRRKAVETLRTQRDIGIFTERKGDVGASEPPRTLRQFRLHNQIIGIRPK